MKPMMDMWRNERRARWFFAAHAQGALGAGAGYIALLVLAYERIGSAWGATAVLLADLLPAMLLGPLLGAAIDRTSRLGGAILADVIRASAFGALVFTHGTGAMIALALLAGFGTALFRPSTWALLPGLVAPTRLAPATGLFNAVRDTGQLLGPVLAAGLLVVASPAAVLGINAITFGLSALLLLRLRGHIRRPAAADADEDGTADSLRGVLRDRVVRIMVGTSATVTLCAATMNVGELVLAQRDLKAGATGFALLVSVYGFGLIVGALCAGRDGGDARLCYFAGLAGIAVGMLSTAFAPGLGFALFTFGFTGAANGLFSTSNRILLTRAIPERVHGRAFGLVDSLDSWGFGLAVIAGGALATAFGGRAIFGISGTILLVVWACAAFLLRERTSRAPVPTLIPATQG
ncbi:MFS transporter [Solirubrobacter phytolaccae]|uniref:MFS transporter n=1 Tax=Solirubrobacter phytolaccae TaxID=1404360 RepID=A0A9X3N825_9ACTN|nr:MFS transporter [Solirubrobacter phytolaccae]MDA0180144.1 MFS transporter [Solirubrobacter phytolaccae]